MWILGYATFNSMRRCDRYSLTKGVPCPALGRFHCNFRKFKHKIVTLNKKVILEIILPLIVIN